MTKISTAVLFSVLGLVVSGAALADSAAGQQKAKQVCAACHGENGDKGLQPDYPVLAGQHRDYLVKALTDYKTGKRKNAIMASQVEKMSEQDIRDLAEWFSSRPGPLSIKR
jgi:cytochrome c553